MRDQIWKSLPKEKRLEILLTSSKGATWIHRANRGETHILAINWKGVLHQPTKGKKRIVSYKSFAQNYFPKGKQINVKNNYDLRERNPRV